MRYILPVLGLCTGGTNEAVEQSGQRFKQIVQAIMETNSGNPIPILGDLLLRQKPLNLFDYTLHLSGNHAID